MKEITPFLQNLPWLPTASRIRLKLPGTTPLEQKETSARLSAHPLSSSFPEPLRYLTSMPLYALFLQPSLPLNSFSSSNSLFFSSTCATGRTLYPLKMVQRKGDVLAVI